jgi:hypothetical protein
MKRRIFYCLLAGALLSSCSNKNPDHPLIIPPEFNVMPSDDLDNIKKEKTPMQSDDQIEELRDLLLD